MKHISRFASLFLVFSLISQTVTANSGFEDRKILDALKKPLEETTIQVVQIIEGAFETVENSAFVQFFISTEGELFVLNDEMNLLVMVALETPSGGKVIPCKTCLKALEKRVSGFSYYTEKMKIEDAVEDRFEFKESIYPDSCLDALKLALLSSSTKSASCKEPKLKRFKRGAEFDETIVENVFGFLKDPSDLSIVCDEDL